MKINFSKLGVLEQGSLEFADLTIICGENNTGKTYITYLVYCLLKTWKQLIEIDIKTEIKQLIEQGSIDIDLDKKIVKNWDKLSSQTVERFHENFPDMLAASGLLFENLKLDVELNLDLSWHQKEFKKEIRSGGGILLLSMQKDENSTILKLAAPKQENSKSISLSSLDDFIEEELFKIVLADIIPDVFIASTERTGATTFRKQLNLATSNLVDLLSQVQKDGEKSLTPHKLINAVYGSKDYAQPVKDNVIFVNQNFIGQNPNNQTQNQSSSFLNGDFIKGALIGAVATYILTNKNAQESIFETINKVKNLATAGFEELKERIEDAKAASKVNEQEF
jgi:hypothetical protein